MKKQSLRLLTKEEKIEIFKKLIDRDMTITDLSKKMEYSRAYIYKVLNGQKNYTKEFEKKLNEILGENYEQ